VHGLVLGVTKVLVVSVNDTLRSAVQGADYIVVSHLYPLEEKAILRIITVRAECSEVLFCWNLLCHGLKVSTCLWTLKAIYIFIATELVHIWLLAAVCFAIRPEVRWTLFPWLIHCWLVVVDFVIFLGENGCSFKLVHHCVMTVIWCCFGTPDLFMILADQPQRFAHQKRPWFGFSYFRLVNPWLGLICRPTFKVHLIPLCELSKLKKSPFIGESIGLVYPLWIISLNNRWARNVWIQLTVGCRMSLSFRDIKCCMGVSLLWCILVCKEGQVQVFETRFVQNFFCNFDSGFGFSISPAVVGWWL